MGDRSLDDSGPSGPPRWILIVDDDEEALRVARGTLLSSASGLDPIQTCTNGREVRPLLERLNVSVVLLDLNMPDIRGEELLASIHNLDPDLPVIVVTSEDEVESAVNCMKLGATDYLVKPVDRDRLVAAVERARDQRALRHENKQLREHFLEGQLENPEVFADILTTQPEMLRIFAYLEAVSVGPEAVLIRGETGTGKELIARAIHGSSGRSGRFVPINIAAVDPQLLNSALFGHTKGAFTSAYTDHEGVLADATGGTLFLDEIGDLTDECQVKLLRVLQERTFRRVGDNEPREFGGRIVAATHRDLSTLREDFVQRLKTHMVEIPPLRERLGDLGVLVEHFLAKAAIRFFKKKPTVPEHLYGYLENYDFPGNVRELENIVSDAVAQHRRGVMPIDLFLRRIEEKRGSRPREAPAHSEKIVFPHPMPTLNEIDLSAVLEAMRRTGDNKTAAARILGVARATVIRVLQRANSAKKLEREPPNDGDESG